MDKNAIKKYAIWARRELIERVAQRAAMYGITEKGHGDPDAESVDGRLLSPVERRQRQALIQKITEKGYQQVIEEVAYTWFNRFAALRFMEVNGYLPTHIRVFTNDANEFKPQILSEAIHLELEGLNRNRVYDLENENKREELFKYLLTVQCNALNEILPGMFQKIEDYTELLLPDNLLRQGSVIEQMITMIPEADWTDQVQIIGWLYQYYNTEIFDSVYDGNMSRSSVPRDLIPAATQIFTPEWVVNVMVENSLGRLWLEGKSEIRNQKSETEREAAEKRLAEEKGWKYYLPEAPQEPEVQAQLNEIRKEYAALKPEEIKVIDPCMGSGHILCVLFDVLVQIYEDYGYSAREAAVSIVENNLWGLDIDERAAQLSNFAVMMKARQYDRRFFTRKVQPHVYAIEESNGINSLSMHNMGLHLSQHECDKAIKQTMQLIDEMHNAKEYGSIIHVTPCDWNLLRRFAVPSNENEQLHLDAHGEIEVSARLQVLINIGEALSQKYDVVVTNPPYLGNKRFNTKLGDYIKRYYPEGKADLAMAMLERIIWGFTKVNGYCSGITTVSWMYLKNIQDFRKKVIEESDFVCLFDYGTELFEGKIGHLPIASWVSRNSRIRQTFPSIRLVDFCYSRRDEKQSEYHNLHNRFNSNQTNYMKIEGMPVAYWLSNKAVAVLDANKSFDEMATTRAGMITGNNEIFVRQWHEVNYLKMKIDAESRDSAVISRAKWFPYSKGGNFRKWFGNNESVVNWYDDGFEMRNRKDNKGNIPAHAFNLEYIFKTNICWNSLSTNRFSARLTEKGFLYDAGGSFASVPIKYVDYYLGFLNSSVAYYYLTAFNPTLNFQKGNVGCLPIAIHENRLHAISELVNSCVTLAKSDWDSFETSWDFRTHPMFSWSHGLWDVTAIMCSIHTYLGRDTLVKTPIEASWLLWKIECEERFKQLKANEEELNRIFIDIYGLKDELSPEVADRDVTVRRADLQRDIRSFISYAVGCMFGRYSLDKEGLIFAGGNFDEMFSKRKEYLAMDYYNPDEPPAKEYICLKPREGNNIQLTYAPDKDNVLPICDDEYFADDIVGRFVKFVERIYGKDSLEDNLRFIADALGGKGAARDVIRSYFLNDFYADHLKVYQKRPIYWLFDSGKKNGFKCLIYMHRYQPDTIARIRTDYIHEQQSRYRTAIADLEQRISGASTSERVKLSKQLTKLQDQAEELRVYEEKIHHLADQMIKIDLDDGVKVNYAKFQDVLAPIK